MEFRKLSQLDSFSLLGRGETAQLALDGEIVTVNDLRRSGFTVTLSKEMRPERNFCFRCAPEGTGVARSWFEVSIKCNGIRGDIWICSNCSAVYKHRRGGKALWEELTKE